MQSYGKPDTHSQTVQALQNCEEGMMSLETIGVYTSQHSLRHDKHAPALTHASETWSLLDIIS